MLAKLSFVGACLVAAPSFADGGVPAVEEGGITTLVGEVTPGEGMETPQACGTFIFDALTSGGGAYAGTGWTVSDGYVGVWEPSHEFTVSSSGTICNVNLVLGHVVGPNVYEVTIYKDSGGLPGSAVQSVGGIAAANSFGSSVNVQSVSFNAAVTPGTYWVGVKATGSGGTWGALNWNNNGFAVHMANDNGSGDYDFGFQNASCWQVEQGAGGPALAKTGGSCPGSMSYQVTGATPGGQVGLIFSASTGAFVIPGSFACAGTQLGLGSSGIQLVANTAADGSGTANFRGNAPQSACNRFLQAIDVQTCGTTNVVQIN